MSRSLITRKIKNLIAKAHQESVNQDSRRQFIKSALLTSAAALPAMKLLTACTAMKELGPNNLTSNHKPVIIIGGGIAGLTAAYYLTKASKPCVIFEASARTGGRMFTKPDFNSERMTCELGAEFIDSNHEDLIQLCAELKIPLDGFAVGDQGLKEALYYFNGRHYTDEQLIPLFKPFARKLAIDIEKTNTPEGMAQLDQLSLESYLQSFRKVEPWIIDLVRVAYVTEMGLESTEQSAISMILTLSPVTKDGFKIYGDSDEAYRVRNGNQNLISALENYLETRGVLIHRNSPLINLKSLSRGIQASVQKENSIQTFISEKVICTVPFSVLRSIEGIAQLPLNPLKLKCIRELGYATNGKLMLGYRSKLWRKSIRNNRLIVPASNGSTWSDLPSQSTWETSRTQKGKSGIITCYTGGKVGASLNAAHTSTLLQAIEKIYPGTENLHDTNSAIMGWNQYRWNLGTYACARPGQYTEFGSVAGESEISGSLLFAGEHAADKFQGFMNGACRSGKLAAESIIKTFS